MTTTPTVRPPGRGRWGEGTSRLREYTLWPMDVLLALWPLALAQSYANKPAYTHWTLPFLVLQAAEATACGIVLHRVAAHKLDGAPVPRWCLALLAVTAVAGAATAVGALPPGVASPPRLAAELTIVVGGPLYVLAPLLSTGRVVLLGLTSAGAVAAGTALARRLLAPAGTTAPRVLIPVALALVLIPLATRWSFAILSSVRAQEKLDLMQADLAVAQERLRIARDLHDVFGRTLTAVAVKSELAAALANAEAAPRAAAESRRVRALADDALKEVRAVLAEYRRPDLATELAGAHSLLAAAGIATRTIGETSVPAWAAEPLALVLREAATNVVRHSEARSCTIRVTLDDDGAALTVANDGARAPAAQAAPVGPVPPARPTDAPARPAGPASATDLSGPADAAAPGAVASGGPGRARQAPSSGLAGLAARIGAVGGTLVARREGDAFTVTARVPGPPSAPEAPAAPEAPTAPARKEEHHD
ncbi:sensor histidine kinase [Actinomyces israelii]|uniref:sensor histidine kinase n=1 Tax=Actinomyces israelii TaxID=1659 RepID=UPI002354878E|nr:sensor histidine kinase [Actinomyces israelii]